MKIVDSKLVLVALLLLCLGGSSARAFQHPGIPFTIEDLSTVKANLTNQPWASGYAALVADGHSSTNYTMQGPFGHVARNEGGVGTNINLTQFENDIKAAYYLSLMWYFTSNSAYAQKSRDILIAWANTMTNLSGYEGQFVAGGDAPQFVTGADILRGTWPGWTFSDTTNYQRYLTNVIWPMVGVPWAVMSANQGGFGQMGAVAIAVFCDDTNRLNQAIASLTWDSNSGFRDTLPNGEVGDSQRDQGHAFGQIWQLAWCAEILWKQGVDVFSLWDNRVLATAEYYCRHNLPGPPQPHQYFGATYVAALYPYTNFDPRSSTQNRFVFNMVHGAYVTRLGISAPWTTLYRNDQVENADSFVYRKSADTSAATPITVTFPPTASLTTGLTSANLNGATPAGSTVYSSGVWTLASGYGGNDPWNTGGNDTVRFAYKQVTGDFTMIAQVTSVANVGSGSAKAGIMLRDALGTATNRNWIAITAVTNCEREVIGWTNMPYGINMATKVIPVPQMPYWVKMERMGMRVQVFHSPNGADWSPSGVADMPTMPPTMYVGLFGTSLVTGTAGTATFANVRITGGDGGEAPKIPPAPFAVYAGPGDAQAQLRWTEAFDASSYNVKRSLTSGGGYSTIATVTNTTFTDTGLSNGTNYYYVVTALNSAGESTNSIEDGVTPQPTLFNVASAGSMTASANTGSTTEGPGQGFDFNPGTKWFNGNAGTTGWIRYDLGASTKRTVTCYAITSANDVPGRDPKNWDFQGSQNASTWTTVDTQTNQTFTYRYQTLNYSIANTNAYRFYRLNITANNADATGVQLSELALLSPAAPPQLSATISNQQLQVAWPATHTGWRLLTQTNSVATGLGTNWALVSSSTATNQLTLPVSTNGSVFFRLIYP